MLASRVLLTKNAAAAALSVQPARLAHQGDNWGNWGHTNVALVYSGCGWWDGTDVHEATYTMYHLSRNGARFQLFAPNQQQMHVVDHSKKQPSSGENRLTKLLRDAFSKSPEGESGERNMQVESWRFLHNHLGQMQVQDLNKLDVNTYDALIFPGGHGILKNLSTYSKDGKDCKLHGDVERVLKDFHKNQKPIGLSSMAPLLACRVLPNLEVTMGYERDESSRWGAWPNTQLVQAVKSMGAKHNIREPYEAYCDEKNRVVSTPSFMWETDLHYHYIHDGIGSMVKHLLRMTAK